MVGHGPLASGYIMVWRTLLYVMQWWLFKEKVRVVSLLGHPREIRESRDYGEMFSDISDIHYSTYSKQWIKLGFWMLKTLFTCLLYSMSIHRINLTWVNFAYDVISSLKIWPHRDIIIKHSPEEFIKKYPITIAIVDAKSPVHNKSTDRVTVLTSPTQPLSLS